MNHGEALAGEELARPHAEEVGQWIPHPADSSANPPRMPERADAAPASAVTGLYAALSSASFTASSSRLNGFCRNSAPSTRSSCMSEE